MPKMHLRFPITVKLSAFIGLIVIVIVGILTVLDYNAAYEELEDKYGLTLKHVAINTALQIDGNKHRQIVQGTKEGKAYFPELREKMRRIMKANYLTKETFYTFHIDGDGELSFAVMAHDKPFTGNRYQPPSVNRMHFDEVRRGQPVQTRIYKDDHGEWISGLAPILDGDEVVGVVEADLRVSEFVAALSKQITKTDLIAAGILVVALIIVGFLSRRITHPIRKLRETSLAIAEGDYSRKLDIRTRDEIQDLGESFNRMMNSLGERYLMLKYISPHTQRMIEQQIHNEEAHIAGGKKNLVIMFSDIRGFTAYSENRDPGVVIENLNRLLGDQSRIITEFGGDIDKFVGDEIVAVFDGENAALRAILAGNRIQEMMQEANSQMRFDAELAVGIGITAGEVVMGNIGSDDRKDFTIIGANVNLAARICSAAGAGEVLFSSDVHRGLSEACHLELQKRQLVISPKGVIKAKGFTEPIHVFQTGRAELAGSDGE